MDLLSVISKSPNQIQAYKHTSALAQRLTMLKHQVVLLLTDAFIWKLPNHVIYFIMKFISIIYINKGIKYLVKVYSKSSVGVRSSLQSPGSQPPINQSHKPVSRLPLLSGRPTFTPQPLSSEYCHPPAGTTWWQRPTCMNNLTRVAPDNAVSGIQIHELLIASPLP